MSLAPASPWIAVAALLGCAFLPLPALALVGLMLFLPLADKGWQLPGWRPGRAGLWWARAATLLAIAGLVAWQPQHARFALTTLAWAALPEEWFFRGWLQRRLETGGSRPLTANLLASLAFAALHAITRGWLVAVQVFWPSLVFGWLYQRTRDLPLVVLVHALSNVFFVIFLAEYIPQ